MPENNHDLLWYACRDSSGVLTQEAVALVRARLDDMPVGRLAEMATAPDDLLRDWCVFSVSRQLQALGNDDDGSQAAQAISNLLTRRSSPVLTQAVESLKLNQKTRRMLPKSRKRAAGHSLRLADPKGDIWDGPSAWRNALCEILHEAIDRSRVALDIRSARSSELLESFDTDGWSLLGELDLTKGGFAMQLTEEIARRGRVLNLHESLDLQVAHQLSRSAELELTEVTIPLLVAVDGDAGDWPPVLAAKLVENPLAMSWGLRFISQSSAGKGRDDVEAALLDLRLDGPVECRVRDHLVRILKLPMGRQLETMPTASKSSIGGTLIDQASPTLCLEISGQARGLLGISNQLNSFASLAGASVVISVWDTVGRKLPVPMLGHANRGYPPHFWDAWNRLQEQYSYEYLARVFPRLCSDESQKISRQEIQEAFPQAVVDVEADSSLSKSNIFSGHQHRMLHKIQRTHNLAMEKLPEHDLYMRMRPDRPVSWRRNLAELSRRDLEELTSGSAVALDAAHFLHPYNHDVMPWVGDQYALGSGQAISQYAETLDYWWDDGVWQSRELGIPGTYSHRAGHRALSRRLFRTQISVYALTSLIEIGWYSQQVPSISSLRLWVCDRPERWRHRRLQSLLLKALDLDAAEEKKRTTT